MTTRVVEILERDRKKRCAKCGMVARHYLNSTTKDGLSARCVECEKRAQVRCRQNQGSLEHLWRKLTAKARHR